MTKKHLSDAILQAYLLKEIQDDSINKHLKECLACQQKFEEYQFLIENVQKVKTDPFSFDVTSLVMEKIKEAETRKEKKKHIVLYMSLSTVSIAAMGLLYPYIKILFTQFKSFSIITNFFMLVSALGVAAFLLFDLFRQYQQKEKLLSQ